MLSVLEWLAERADNILCVAHQPVRIAVPVGDDCEFVAADPCQEITRAGDGADHGGGMTQHGVACAMTKRVVDFLETIEIDMEHRKGW